MLAIQVSELRICPCHLTVEIVFEFHSFSHDEIGVLRRRAAPGRFVESDIGAVLPVIVAKLDNNSFES